MNARLLDRLGIAGVLALGLLLFCLAFYLGSYAPARQSLDDLQSQEIELKALAASQANAAGLKVGAGETAQLPLVADAPEVIKALNAIAAKHGVTVERAQAVLVDQQGTRRMDIDLPLRGNYPALRSYMHEILTQAHARSSLSALNLRRQSALDPAIEAELHLSYYFAPPA